MAEVAITSVDVKNNPAPFADEIELEVQYECLTALKDDLEWKVIYVGSAETEEHDQVLDTAFVGPVQPGAYKFTMRAPAPDAGRIPQGDVVGVTALLLTCSYQVG
jgi:histone chaperone ASF1